MCTTTHTHATQVNFWDVRVDRLMKKGRKAEDSLELLWKPTHSLHIISLIGVCVCVFVCVCVGMSGCCVM